MICPGGTSTQTMLAHGDGLAAANGAASEFWFDAVDVDARDLLRAVDLESFWQASLRLLRENLPHHSCSLMLGIDAQYTQPRTACHHVAVACGRDYRPATSLTVSGPFLANHPRVRLYTYSQILAQDRQAQQRRLDQGEPMEEWAEFVHLAFWEADRLLAVFSIRRADRQPVFTHDEIQFLRHVYPLIDAGVHRLHALERERLNRSLIEQALDAAAAPYLLLDESGDPAFVNAAARQLVATWNNGLPPSPPWSAWALPDGSALPWRRFGMGIAPYEVAHPRIPELRIRLRRVAPRDGLFAGNGHFLVDFIGAHAAPSRSAGLLEKLSPSERKVALLVAEGLRNYEIAERLFRSRRTIESQLNSIYAKFDINSRVQLAQALRPTADLHA